MKFTTGLFNIGHLIFLITVMAAAFKHMEWLVRLNIFSVNYTFIIACKLTV